MIVNMTEMPFVRDAHAVCFLLLQGSPVSPLSIRCPGLFSAIQPANVATKVHTGTLKCNCGDSLKILLSVL